MIFHQLILLFFVFLFIGNSTVKSQVKKQDNVVGAIWVLTLTSDGESKDFRVRATKDHKVFLGPEEIGRWDKSGANKVVLDFTTKRPLLNGVMVLNKSRNNPPTYLGKLKKTDGTEVNARLVMIED